jgi:uncharacterized short protein YbdD (DUF466 family)
MGERLMLKKIKHSWHIFWSIVRQLSGDDAYKQYLKHHAEFHASNVDVQPALTRKAFYKMWQDNKWKGIKRCC